MFNRSGYLCWLVGGVTLGLSACGVGLDTDQMESIPSGLDPTLDPENNASDLMLNKFRVTYAQGNSLGYLINVSSESMTLYSPNGYFYAIMANGAHSPSMGALKTLYVDYNSGTDCPGSTVVPGSFVAASGSVHGQWTYSYNGQLYRPKSQNNGVAEKITVARYYDNAGCSATTSSDFIEVVATTAAEMGLPATITPPFALNPNEPSSF